MVRGNTSDLIGHPLPKDSISAHGASHHGWAPAPPLSKSGAGQDELTVSTTTLNFYGLVKCVMQPRILFNDQPGSLRQIQLSG